MYMDKSEAVGARSTIHRAYKANPTAGSLCLFMAVGLIAKAGAEIRGGSELQGTTGPKRNNYESNGEVFYLFLFQSRDKSKASSRRDMCLKATQT
jgi:hypothetical protein